jgi:predicted RNA methylase
VDICRERFDVVLMNPPFGIPPTKVFEFLKRASSIAPVELYAAFIVRAWGLAPDGLFGVISSRSFLMTPRLSKLRESILVDGICLVVDLGAQINHPCPRGVPRGRQA